MGKLKVEDIIFELAKPIAEQNSYELVDVEFLKEGSSWYLRIYIDKPGGISIDDCQIVSEGLSDILDKKDPIEQAYFLEVSSPGLERPLKTQRDFDKYKGEDVELKFFKPIAGSKTIIGKLNGLIDNKVVIIDEKGNSSEYDRNTLSHIKRYLKF
jgi:ribosome maturation factor RimP